MAHHKPTEAYTSERARPISWSNDQAHNRRCSTEPLFGTKLPKHTRPHTFTCSNPKTISVHDEPTCTTATEHMIPTSSATALTLPTHTSYLPEHQTPGSASQEQHPPPTPVRPKSTVTPDSASDAKRDPHPNPLRQHPPFEPPRFLADINITTMAHPTAPPDCFDIEAQSSFSPRIPTTPSSTRSLKDLSKKARRRHLHDTNFRPTHTQPSSPISTACIPRTTFNKGNDDPPSKGWSVIRSVGTFLNKVVEKVADVLVGDDVGASGESGLLLPITEEDNKGHDHA